MLARTRADHLRRSHPMLTILRDRFTDLLSPVATMPVYGGAPGDGNERVSKVQQTPRISSA
jgi:hypothetical protein